MLKRALILLVAVLSASAPLMRGYCQLTCTTNSTTAKASAAGAQHSCHDASSSGDAIGPAGPACGHRGESPVAALDVAMGRLLSADTQHATLVTSPIITVDTLRLDGVAEPPGSSHQRSRPQPDVLRI